MSAGLIERLRGGTMGFDWSELPDDALIPAVPLLREAAAHIGSLETRLRDTEANSELRLRRLIEANDELEAYRAAALAAREATR